MRPFAGGGDAASMRRLRRIGLRRLLLWTAIALVGLFAIAQAVPYGRSHSNPPVLAEPAWASAHGRELTVRACYDCHSNETSWPWYSNLAPISWLVQHDVDEGRTVLNFSEWGQVQREAAEAVETVQEGEMPPLQYRLLHGSARLSDAERAELVKALQALR
jgi:hypothetical protein